MPRGLKCPKCNENNLSCVFFYGKDGKIHKIPDLWYCPKDGILKGKVSVE